MDTCNSAEGEKRSPANVTEIMGISGGLAMNVGHTRGVPFSWSTSGSYMIVFKAICVGVGKICGLFGSPVRRLPSSQTEVDRTWEMGGKIQRNTVTLLKRVDRRGH